MKLSFIPQDNQFFTLFVESAQNACEVAQKLRDLLYNWTGVEDKIAAIADLEHKGDNVTHQVAGLLHRTFVTPFDREDIAALSHTMDDVTDFIHSAADAMLLYRITEPTQRAKELSDVIVEITAEVEKAVTLLNKKLDQREMLKYCVEINRLENVADRIYRAALAELFAKSTDVVYIMKWREIYEHMETVTDRCEDVANVLEGVAIKYS
ncbi:MAG: phosphate transport regulator [Chloroflexi bacterium RBG_13_46_9]|jgi:predicted phosphate transport protein (TIGR00153 family)|nr:MAG: phosphate transport regulator [Chloroflexi bacterium RBG_13_46_9]